MEKESWLPRAFIAETAMLRMKMLFTERLSLRDYDAEVWEAMARVKAMNRGCRSACALPDR